MTTRSVVAGALGIIMIWGVAGLAAQTVPTAIVERHSTLGDTMTRISLFDNRMAVTTVRERDTQVFFRQLTLEELEYGVYLQVIEEVVDRLSRDRQSSLDSGEAEVVITVALPGRSPRTIRFSPLEVLDLATARLMAALDDLELRVRETSPSREALRGWKPRQGDRVELFSRTMATDDEVREDGVIVLIHDDTGIIEVVPLAEAARVILRLVE